MTPSIYEPVVVERVVEGRVGVLRGTLAAMALATDSDVLNDCLMKDMHTSLGITILSIKEYESI